jgi:hypothetical protein
VKITNRIEKIMKKKIQAGMMAYTCKNPTYSGDSRIAVQNQTGQKVLQLPQLQKQAGQGLGSGTQLWSQLLRRWKQEDGGQGQSGQNFEYLKDWRHRSGSRALA